MIDGLGNAIQKGDVIVVSSDTPIIKGEVVDVIDHPIARPGLQTLPLVKVLVTMRVVPGGLFKLAVPEKQ